MHNEGRGKKCQNIDELPKPESICVHKQIPDRNCIIDPSE